MVGVNLDNLDTLIKKNNFYLDSFNSNSKKLVSAISDLNACYKGSGLEYLFSKPINEIKNIQKISKVIENYSNILYNVRISYKKQEQNIQTQINHISSKLQ